jgi:hypothetical protein
MHKDKNKQQTIEETGGNRSPDGNSQQPARMTTSICRTKQDARSGLTA